ncbi:MAG TPA: 23S rRNA (pseudouridine(1915)-N(3))-methyltransferase RlmH [Bacteroidales bacterium]|nr:23S rRNA (pseudouridine(1915)-N(3))-methyltransferase RlmH [Bacteroidales bacterium]
MKITLLYIGKTDKKELLDLCEMYYARISKYISFQPVTIPDIKNSKNMSIEQVATLEGNEIIKKLKPTDYLVLLDENGKETTSRDFAVYLNKRMVSGCRNLCFVIGGAYGFSDEVYAAAHDRLSLSKMTFSHQLVRLIFAEQLYRAFSILANEPYHHD